jgi:cholesterol transport system auxiliary component
MMALARLAAAGALAALAACSTFGDQEAHRYHVLEAPAGGKAAAAPRAATLLVAPATASSFYETQDIVYSRAPGTRAYYQYHGWTERPARRITELVVARLERAAQFKNVAPALSGVRGDLVLNLHLAELYHDALDAPGRVRVVLTAELLDPARRTLIARRTFEQSAPAATYDAPGAVRAFNQAVAAMLDEMAAWIDGVAPR